jgi:hypothetical protein
LINAMVRTPKGELDIRKKQYKAISDTIPSDLREMALSFDKALEKAIKLSIFRMEFFIYFSRILVIAVFKSIITRSFKTIMNVFKVSFRDIYINENILIPTSNRRELAC